MTIICRNKWHPRASEISTPLEIALGTHFDVQHATKATSVLLPVDGEASWLLLPSLVLLLSGNTVQPGNIFLYPQGDMSGLRIPNHG